MLTYNQILDNIFTAYPMYHKIGSAAYKEGLENIEDLLQILDNPHKKLRCVHIAGTNGKGSVSSLLASYFQEAGYKTGLFTSPHLVDFRERIRINGEMISEDAVVDFFEQNNEKFSNIEPSFFEITTALAFSYFASQNVDIAIVEVGLGGRLDATNVINPILSVITNISLEHTQLLGNTIAKIAKEKAGIIKHKTPVVIGEFNNESFPVFEDIATNHDAPLFLADANFYANAQNNCVEIFDNENQKLYSLSDVPLSGSYQLKNIVTFIQCVDVLKFLLNIQKDFVEIAIKNVLKNTSLQGRWQILSENPKIICDVGHNYSGIKYNMSQIKTECAQNANVYVVFGMVKDKDIDNILELLNPSFKYFVCCAKIDRALDPSILANKMREKNLQCAVFQSVEDAVDEARKNAGADDVIFITGSCFVVGEALQCF